MSETTNEQSITTVDVVDDEMTPTGESVPRRFAVQSIVGGFAGLAALAGAAGVGAQEKKKKKSTKKTTSKQKVGAQAARSGQLNRIIQITDSVRVPSNANKRDRLLTLVCPRAKNSERAFVVGGGYSINRADPAFVVTRNAPTSRTRWEVYGHNTIKRPDSDVQMNGYAICAYFRK